MQAEIEKKDELRRLYPYINCPEIVLFIYIFYFGFIFPIFNPPPKL